MFLENSKFQKTSETSSTAVENGEATKDSGQDRRYFPRWELHSRLLYRKKNDIVYRECQTKDLNCDGVCFTSKDDIPLHQEIVLTIYLTDDIAIHLRGKTLWNRRTKSGHLVGVHFNSVSKKAHDLLLEFAFDNDQQDSNKHWFEGWK
mgnify:CR=1 FL=1